MLSSLRGEHQNCRQSLIKKHDFLYLVKKKNKTIFKIDVSKLKKEGDSYGVLQKRKMASM